MRRSTLHRTAAAVTAAAVLGGGGAAAVAQLSGSEPAEPQARPNAIITEVDADQLAAFGVLRGESGAAADLTPEAAALVDTGLGPDVGASATLARDAGQAPDGTELYVVPGQGWLCLVTGDGGGGCNRTADVIAGYGLTLQRQGDLVAIAGLVPDGVSAVEIRGPDASAVVDVSANVWSGDVPFAPTSVRWTDADGPVHDIPVSVPADLPTGPPAG